MTSRYWQVHRRRWYNSMRPKVWVSIQHSSTITSDGFGLPMMLADVSSHRVEEFASADAFLNRCREVDEEIARRMLGP